MSLAEILAVHGIKLSSTTPGRYYTTCPQCAGTRSTKAHQKSKVLGVTIEADGARWGCNHCGWTGPEKASGRKREGSDRRRELETYIYRDVDGTVRFRKVRNLPGRQPRFWLERP